MARINESDPSGRHDIPQGQERTKTDPQDLSSDTSLLPYQDVFDAFAQYRSNHPELDKALKQAEEVSRQIDQYENIRRQLQPPFRRQITTGGVEILIIPSKLKNPSSTS